MMRSLRFALWLAVCAGAASSGWAQSVCPGGSNRLNQTQLAATFTGKTLCMTRGNERWQEFHESGGALYDYKLGPSSTVDPTERVGSWSVVGTGSNTTLSHAYTSGTWSWAVCETGTPPSATYTLIGSGGTITGGTLKAGKVAC